MQENVVEACRKFDDFFWMDEVKQIVKDIKDGNIKPIYLLMGEEPYYIDRISEFIEKPEHPTSDLANAGIYVLSKEAWYEIADIDVFDFGFDVIPHFVGRMHGYLHDGYHRDIGTHESLAQAETDAQELFK